MVTFYVWDPDSDDEERARPIEGYSAERAAERYAENDVDGMSDGIYGGTGLVLNVKDADGNVSKVRVTVEYEPTFYSTIEP